MRWDTWVALAGLGIVLIVVILVNGVRILPVVFVAVGVAAVLFPVSVYRVQRARRHLPWLRDQEPDCIERNGCVVVSVGVL